MLTRKEIKRREKGYGNEMRRNQTKVTKKTENMPKRNKRDCSRIKKRRVTN